MRRLALALAWPPALVAAVYLLVGRLGFYPTDEGLVLAYSYRILQGEVPHRDFISPRPLGSALLHLVDFVVPGPLFEVSRVISLCEYAAYGILFGWLIYALSPKRWSLAMAAGAAGSMLVNLNVFPIMAWYTVDGLLLIAAGFVLVRIGTERDSTRLIAAGFLVVGLAALTKQSFVPAAAFAWPLMWERLRGVRWPARVRWLIITGLLAATPSVIFITVISALGGLGDLQAQILGTDFTYGRALLSAWSPHHDLAELAPLVAATGLLTYWLEAARKSSRPRATLILSGRVVLTALVVAVPVAARLGASGSDWGYVVFWIACACWLVRAASSRTPEAVGLALIGCAWMSALSYGFAYPNLVCGSLGLYVVHGAWAGARWPSGMTLRAAPAIGAIALLAVTAYVFDGARVQDVYRDRPASQLTAELSSVSPAFGGIRTNPQTAAYLQQMADCVRRYPAHRVAILSENAGMYPALSLDNPFPIETS